MATIEERIIYQKAKEMSKEELKSFLKAVPGDVFLEEINRRMTIATEIREMAGVITEKVRNAS